MSGHYVRRPGRSATPRAFVSVVCTTAGTRRPKSGKVLVDARLASVHVAASHRPGAKWTRPGEYCFRDAGPFWLWLDSFCSRKYKTWVVAPIASDALTLLGFWGRLDELGCRFERSKVGPVPTGPNAPSKIHYIIRKLVLSGNPDIIEYSYCGRSVVWVSLTNFGIDPPPTRQDPDATGPRYPDQSAVPPDPADPGAAGDATYVLESVKSLADWYCRLGSGQFAPTVASLGYQYYRSRLPAKSVSTHSNATAATIEREACHGAFARTFYFGDVLTHLTEHSGSRPLRMTAGANTLSGPVYLIDVRSMYPSLLASSDYPTKLISVRQVTGPSGLSDILSCLEAVARVRVVPRENRYPLKGPDRVDYPARSFVTTLAGPELRRALGCGEITHVYDCSVYERGRPWAAAAGELIEMRLDAKRSLDIRHEQFVKLLTNAATGKLAQASYRWEDRPSKSPPPNPDTGHPLRWGKWLESDPHSARAAQLRAIAGLTQERVIDEPRRGGLPASWAYLVSYGRCLIQKLVALAGVKESLSCDTDGLWVTEVGLLNIRRAGVAFGSDAGCLQIVRSAYNCRWFSPRHYWVDGEWILSGFRGHSVSRDGLAVKYSSSHNDIRSGTTGAPSTIRLIEHEHILLLERLVPPLRPDGWAEDCR